LYILGSLFLVVALLESLADKIPLVEQWLLPVSTAWRPFAAVAVATLVAVSSDVQPSAEEPAIAIADTGFWSALSGALLAVVLGAAAGWLATIGKTGTRLLITLVPVPGLRLLHSFVDDFFALGMMGLGLLLGDTTLALVLVGAYLLVGLFTGPILTRLTWIHFRIGVALVRKGFRSLRGAPPAPLRAPGWVARKCKKAGIDDAAVLPCYVHHAVGAGRFRWGYVVLHAEGVAFVTRVFFIPKILQFQKAALRRIGLAETATSRTLVITDETPKGLRNTRLHLFPLEEAQVLTVLDNTKRGGMVRVRPESETARAAVPGYAIAVGGGDRRYRPLREAGDLRGQALITLAAAIGGGILTGGVVIPIGFGYLASPYRLRALVGVLFTAYLALCVVGSFGLGWPAAIVYAVIANAIALRDLTRCALKARLDGFVDRNAFLPLAAAKIWVPAGRLVQPGDQATDRDVAPLTDGGWRAAVTLLRSPAPA
ncbi:MAG: DUF4126 family protein, partial [Myxococcota bacterium]